MKPALKTIQTKPGTKQEIKLRGILKRNILKYKYCSCMTYKYTHIYTQKYTERCCVGVCVKRDKKLKQEFSIYF